MASDTGCVEPVLRSGGDTVSGRIANDLAANAFCRPVETNEIPPLAGELIGPYLENVKLLGQRTAELHVALASDSNDPDFAPEPFSVLYQRSLYQSMRNHSRTDVSVAETI